MSSLVDSVSDGGSGTQVDTDSESFDNIGGACVSSHYSVVRLDEERFQEIAGSNYACTAARPVYKGFGGIRENSRNLKKVREASRRFAKIREWAFKNFFGDEDFTLNNLELGEFWKNFATKFEKLLKNLVKNASSKKSLVKKYFIGAHKKYQLLLISV